MIKFDLKKAREEYYKIFVLRASTKRSDGNEITFHHLDALLDDYPISHDFVDKLKIGKKKQFLLRLKNRNSEMNGNFVENITKSLIQIDDFWNEGMGKRN